MVITIDFAHPFDRYIPFQQYDFSQQIEKFIKKNNKKQNNIVKVTYR